MLKNNSEVQLFSANNISAPLRRGKETLTPEIMQYQHEKVFIADYWDRLLSHTGTYPNKIEPTTGRLELPYSFYPPNDGRWGPVQFYWDNESIITDVVNDQKRIPIAVGIIENFAYMLDTFGIIPNASSEAFLVSSQPPLLTTMIFDTYDALPTNTVVNAQKGTEFVPVASTKNEWLMRMIASAQKEYKEVWMNERDFEEALGNSHHRQEGTELSSYGDRDAGYSFNAERESGWDFTSRFGNRCADFLPIDLNCYLYKYEKDFAKAARILGNGDDAIRWDKKAEERREEVSRLMWDDEKGFFFDFDWKKAAIANTPTGKVLSKNLTEEQINDSRSSFYSLAGFAPMWSGLATPVQAERMLVNIAKFETPHGLVITAKESTPQENQYDLSAVPEFQREALIRLLSPKQWDYPHIWPPLELQVVKGLLQYGFTDRAYGIMQTFLDAESKVFNRNKVDGNDLGFGEKRSAVYEEEKSMIKNFQYTHQTGFSWTCATFGIFLKELDKLR